MVGAVRGCVAFVLVWAAIAGAVEIPIADRLLKVDGRLEFRDVERTDGNSIHQNPEGTIRLGLGLDLVDHLRASTTVFGEAGGPPRHSRGAGVFNLDDTLQDRSPSLDIPEAYLDYSSAAIDVRAGLQRFFWGRLDTQQPNDLLNPQEYHDPVLDEDSDRKVGVPALSVRVPMPKAIAQYGLLDSALTVVWLPIVVPPRVPDLDERWYPPLARIPERGQLLGFSVTANSQIRNVDPPSRSLDNSSVGVRFSTLVGRADVALFYFDGYDPTPVFDVRPRAFATINALDPSVIDLRADVDIVPVYQRIRSFGFDVAYRISDVMMRAEAAYVKDRLYSRSISKIVENQEITIGAPNPALLFLGIEQELPVNVAQVNFPLDAVEWGIGADRFFGDTLVLLQLNQTAILDGVADLVVSNHETRLILKIRRTFFDDQVEANLNSLYGIQGVYGVAQPEILYHLRDHIALVGGYLFIAGRDASSVGQYHHNDEAYLKLRYFF